MNIFKKEELLDILSKRNDNDLSSYLTTTKEIIDNIKKNKDDALIEYTNKFDCPLITKDNIMVTKEEILDAYNTIDKDLLETLKLAKKRIEDYHKLQVRNTFLTSNALDDEILGQKITPLNKVGVYVPGGKAVYPSTFLMDVVPAMVAGVEEIIVVTPANKEGIINKSILAIAYLCNITKIFKIGGAQAIASLAYGTPLVPKVDKIVGPGNIYGTLAKKEVFGKVGIDSIAGPSEILVLADEKANYKYISYDLLSQAEHDELASAILLTTSKELAEKVQNNVNLIKENALRKNILDKSLTNFCGIVILDSIDEIIDLANEIAPEHLEVLLENPMNYLPRIKNAGAIFLGEYTPESLGDYMAGPCHVLPTNGTARFFSPLGVDDFIKKSSILYFSKQKFIPLANHIIKLANTEGLEMHALSAKVRLDENEND